MKIYDMSASPLRFCLLANGCGVGKTVTFLLSIVLTARVREEEGFGVLNALYRPSLVVLPPAIVEQAFYEAMGFFRGVL